MEAQPELNHKLGDSCWISQGKGSDVPFMAGVMASSVGLGHVRNTARKSSELRRGPAHQHWSVRGDSPNSAKMTLISPLII